MIDSCGFVPARVEIVASFPKMSIVYKLQKLIYLGGKP